MAKHSVLVADSDPRSLRILEVALRKAGFSVGTASDGAEALRRLQRTPPDLVLAEVQLPGTDGFALCKAVRADGKLAALPFLLISADRAPAVKLRATELGADDLLVKPLLIKEVVTRVRMLLEQREQERQAQKGAPSGTMNGSLADLGLVDLFQSLEGWKKSAVIICQGPDGREGQIWVREGQIIDAEVAPLAGEAAFYRLLNWDQGVFRVDFAAAGRDVRIKGGTQALLHEGMRRIDEVARYADRLQMRSAFSVDTVALIQRLSDLPDEVNGVLRLFEGRRTIEQVMEVSPLDDLSTLAVVERLLGERVLLPLDAPRMQKPSLHDWLGVPGPMAAPALAPPADAPVVIAPAAPAAPPPPATALLPAPAVDQTSQFALPLQAVPPQSVPPQSDFDVNVTDKIRVPASLVEAEAARERTRAAAQAEADRAAQDQAAQEKAAAEKAAAEAASAKAASEQAEAAPAEPAAPAATAAVAEEERPDQTALLWKPVAAEPPKAHEAPPPAEPPVQPPALALAPSPAALQAAAEAGRGLERILFPPLRGVRRERLRREADDVRAALAAGKPIRLLHAVELPPWSAEGAADASTPHRRVSPAVSDEAKRLTGGEPLFLSRNGAARAVQVAQAAAEASSPTLQSIESDAPIAVQKAAEPDEDERPTPPEVVPLRAAEAAPAGAAAAAAAAAAPVDDRSDAAIEAAPITSPPAEPSAPLPAATEPAPTAAASEAAAPALAEPAAASPAAAAPAVEKAAPAEAAATAQDEEEEDEDQGEGDDADADADADEGDDDEGEGEDEDDATPPEHAAPASPFLEKTQPRAVIALEKSGIDEAPAQSDADLDAEIRAALGGGRRRWPVYAGAAALAATALWIFVLRQPPTDKKDAPWLAGETRPASAPVSAKGDKKVDAPPEIAGSGVIVPDKAPPKVEPPKPPEEKQLAPPPPDELAAPAPRTPAPPPAAKKGGDDYSKAMSSGEALLKRGKYKQAVAEFQKAVKSNGGSVPALLSLGDAFLEADKPASALEPLRKAARLDPQNGRAQLLLGTAHQSLQHNKEAAAAYQRYLELDPGGEFARDVRSILANLQR